MFESTTQVRVRYAETDQMNVVYHGNYAAYFEIARTEAIRAFGITYKEIEDMGVAMPIVDLQIRYLRPAHYDDLLTIKTTVQSLSFDHRIEFHHEVYNENNKLLTQGRVVLYFVNITTHQKCNMPEALKQCLLPYFTAPAE